MDVVVAVSPSPDLIDHVSPDPLDISHVSSCSLPSLSPEYCDLLPIDSLAVLKGNVVDCSESLTTFRGYDPFLDPCRLYLEGMPGEIALIIAFDYSADFSKAFDEFKRALTLLTPSLPVLSYLHHSEIHGAMHDKLLRALTASELMSRVLSDNEEWLMLLRPPQLHIREA